MAQKLAELPPIARSGGIGKTEKYPYDEWFDGQPTLLIAGEDFEGEAKAIRGSLTSAAKRRGLKLKMRSHPQGVVVQSVANGATSSE